MESGEIKIEKTSKSNNTHAKMYELSGRLENVGGNTKTKAVTASKNSER